MRVGDVDGLNSVYRITARRDYSGFVIDFSGTLFLESGEKLLSFRTESLLHIVGSSSKTADRYPSFGGELVEFYPEAGWGTMFITDRRIVFLRKPEYNQLWEAYKSTQHAYGGGIPDRVFNRALRIHRQGAMEYLEIRYEDVTHYEEGKYTATVAVASTTHSEYMLYFDKKDFERIRPILDDRLVEGKKRPLTRYRRELVLLAIELALFAGFVLWDNIMRWILLFGFSIIPWLLLIVYIWRPKLKNVKKNKWGQMRAAFLGTIVAFTVGTVFAALGVIGILMGRGFGSGFFVAMLFSLLLFVLAAAARREWRYYTMNERYVPYKYRCPDCRTLVTRREIGCAKCGAVLWWLHLRKFRLRRHGRKRMHEAWEKASSLQGG